MKRLLALGLLALLWIVTSPAAADWLVTRDGGRVETKGSWQIKGKLVVFTQADGTLSSLRLADVDLEASRKATAEAKARAASPPAPEQPKKKLAVLTDEDFHRVMAPAAEQSADAAAAAPSAANGPLAVGSWKRIENSGGDGIEIQGTLHNETDEVVVNAAVEVQLYNEVGDRVATAAGVLASPAIQPRSTVEFHAGFPGVFTFATVRFAPKGLPLDTGTAAEPKPAENAPPQ
jgi:hypothetical protein